MDPLSIATAATALATFAFKASKGIYGFIDDVRSADATLLQLQNEVNALQMGLQSIAETFSSETVVQLSKKNSNSLNQLQSTRLLNSVMPLLADCEKTLEKLDTVLSGIVGTPGKMRDIFGKPIKAIKISIKSKDVDLIRHEIRSYSSAMQMTLHMVGICLTIDGNKQSEDVGTGIEQKLSVLAAQITDVQQKVSETGQVQSLSGETLVTSESEAKDHTAHIRKHIEAAREVFSNGSVYAGSVSGTVVGDDSDVNGMANTFGSVMGLDEQHRRRINNWLPKEAVSEDSEEDDDSDSEMFDARLSLARKKLKAKDYQAAEAHFQKCLDQTGAVRKMPPHELTDMKLDYSLACQGSGNFAGEQRMLLELLEFDLPKAQTYHLQHRLAVAYLNDSKLDMARSLASQAMKGRRKLQGSRDQAYLETVNLLVRICKAQNNDDDADMYESLLPSSFNAEKSEEPVNSAEQAAAIKALSENGFSIGNKATYFEALKWAADNRQLPALRLLLSQSTDLQGTDVQGRTMLMQAAKHGFGDILQQLLKKGADFKARDKSGRTALHFAASAGQTETARILIDAGAMVTAYDNDKEQPLHDAAYAGHQGVVNLLLDRGADVNSPGIYGRRALTRGTGSGHAMMKLLLDRGADPNGASDDGSTALMILAFTSRPDASTTAMAKLLLDYGANADIKRKNGDTALKLAKKRGNEDMTKLLKSGRTGMFRR